MHLEVASAAPSISFKPSDNQATKAQLIELFFTKVPGLRFTGKYYFTLRNQILLTGMSDEVLTGGKLGS